MARSTPRLIDIAERAKLSVTSVSRILSGQRLSEYSVNTQERVRNIAEELGWRPNLVVQGMKTGQTHTFGVFMAPYDTFWTGVLYGVHDTLLDAKQVPLVLWPHALVHPTVEPLSDEAWAAGGGSAVTHPPPSHEDTDGPNSAGSARRELSRINCLEDRRVDAIIAWPLHEANARERLAALSARGLPVVTIDDMLPDSAKSVYVGGDERATMNTIRAHLEELGHRRVAYFEFNTPHTWASRRREAFDQTWTEAAPTLALEQLSGGRYDHDAINRYIQTHPDVTAVVAATDHVGRHVARALTETGKRVPDDLSIVGYGNDLAGHGDIALTTVDQHPYEVGRAAAQIALNQLDTPDGMHLVPTTLLHRASTQPLVTP
ncbi:MAG: LacI family DNA-binding transcriptional regulator [Planctomycetota bacterium]